MRLKNRAGPVLTIPVMTVLGVFDRGCIWMKAAVVWSGLNQFIRRYAVKQEYQEFIAKVRKDGGRLLHFLALVQGKN
jgi:hypothetical protein